MTIPLSEQLRPRSLKDVVGQDHLLGKNGIIPAIIKSGKPLSIILWGPPGSGKTTIARLYAQAFTLPFVTMSAVFSGVADLKKVLKSDPIVLFVDEIHRFNKAQQDAFLPYLENGTLILIGSTVENPSFYLNKALLSRVRVLRLNYLDDEALEAIFKRYEKKSNRLKGLDPDIQKYLIYLAHGDGRYLLNLIENLEAMGKEHLKSFEDLQLYLQEKPSLFDKDTDQHYNLVSALHKSVRGSDPDAAIYWLCRILQGGENPLFVARRVIRMASEDIGLADPHALTIAIAARDAYEMLGSPEGELAIAEAVVYLALAPKSNALYLAFLQGQESALQSNHLPPPMIILNAPTPMMKKMGYGKDYIYDHDTPEGFSGQHYFPDGMDKEHYYNPVERGFEREMRKRLEYFNQLRKKRQK